MSNKLFDNQTEFLNDIDEILAVVKNNGEESAQTMIETFRVKYDIPAEVTKGADCAGCASCVACTYCPGVAQGMHVGHSMYVWAFND